jgi:AcrR family transcriptional regulator
MDNLDLSRRERKKIESRARILKAARRLFQQKDYDNTSIEEIAETADVSKSTFFNYFPTKESLLDGIAADEIAEIRFLIKADLVGITSPVEKIRI